MMPEPALANDSGSRLGADARSDVKARDRIVGFLHGRAVVGVSQDEHDRVRLVMRRRRVTRRLPSGWGFLASALLGIAALTSAQTPPDVIAANEVTDEQIGSRLDAIFASADEWGDIRVAVSGGVVELNGTVLRAETAEEAVSIAREIEGVVHVIDRLETARELGRTLSSALERLGDRLYELLALVPLLFVALVVFAVFYLSSGLIAEKVHRSRRISENQFVRDIARQVARLAVILVGLLVVLDLLDATAAVGAVLGTAGIFGLALGFAFRDLVENYIASILLSLRHPFAPNDHVIVDGEEGRIIRLTSRATILLTLEGNHLRIPNAKVFKASILNYTTNAKRRFDFAIGVGTDEDVREGLAIGVEALKNVDGVLAEPPASAVVETLGDSTVQLRFRAWIDQSMHDIQKVESAAMIEVKESLDDAGIDMPEPIYRVHMRELAPADPAPSGPARRRRPGKMDVAADDELDRQVHSEREQGEEDLLNPSAPLE